MSLSSILKLDYDKHSGQEAILRLQGLQGRVWLDSQNSSNAPLHGSTDSRRRFDIISAAPIHRVTLKKGLVAVDNDVLPNGSVWIELRKLLHSITSCESDPELPFQGGAIGLFGYEANNAFHKLSSESVEGQIADISIGIYSWALILDHLKQRAILLFNPSCPSELEEDIRSRFTDKIPQEYQDKKFELTSRFQSSLKKELYLQQIEKIQEYIAAGDCYQVNLSQRFSASYSGSSLSAYLKLRHSSPNPFGGWLELEENQAVLCFSPERFVRSANRNIETRPIKGTRPRGKNSREDVRLKAELQTSQKELAENIMIVDLMRNDLGQVCEFGSIKIEDLFKVESYPAVHHLVSSVTGKLKASLNPLDILKNCLPGGSITGAPKRRAMQIIDELEPVSRQAYCGSLAYISCCGTLDSNITIRTLLADGEQIHCWGGGGIVADSIPEQEYQETLDKIGPLMLSLEEIAIAPNIE